MEDEPRYEDGRLVAADEADEAAGPRTARDERRVGAGEGRGAAPSERERALDEPELGCALGGARQHALGHGARRQLEERAARLPVDGAAVVRVDEAEIPELAALVEVGDAGRGELQERLRERCGPAGRDERFDEGLEVGAERRVADDTLDEGASASSYGGCGSIHEVWTFASRDAFSMYCTARSTESGKAPTSVW